MAGGEQREGRREQLTVMPVPRTSSGPVWQLKLNMCALSASSNSYKILQLKRVLLADLHVELLSLFVTSGKLAG